MPAARIYVGRLPRNCREYDLERTFRSFGRIRDIMVKGNYGFIEFDDYRDADDAVYEMNGHNMFGERIIVEMAKAKPARSARRGGPFNYSHGYEVLVENVSSRVNWQELKAMFLKAGDVLRADVEPAKRTGTVWFAHKSDAKRAVEKFDGKDLNGRDLKVLIRERSSRSRSGSKSKSRSRSRSRRRSRSGSRSASPKDKKSKKSRSRSRSGSAKRKSASPAERKSRSGSRHRSGSATEADRPKPDAATNGESKRSRSRSRSGGSPEPKRSRKDTDEGSEKERSASRDREQDGERDGTPPEREEGDKEASRSRSRSGSE